MRHKMRQMSQMLVRHFRNDSFTRKALEKNFLSSDYDSYDTKFNLQYPNDRMFRHKEGSHYRIRGIARRGLLAIQHKEKKKEMRWGVRAES